MATETRPTVEQPLSHEPLQPYESRVGLQTRLLLGGEALNPDKTDLPEVAKDALLAFETRDYGIFQDASTAERKAYWQGKENNEFAGQKAAWIQSTVTTFTNEQTQQFFQSQQGRAWSEIFGRLGISTQSFTNQNAEQLYTRYFEHGKSDIKKFVQDVVRTGANTDLSAIQWLANIFGSNSSEIVAQLIDAEIKLQTQPDVLIQEVNREKRINNLQPREKELLDFLSPHRVTQEEQNIPPIEQTVPNIDVEANREGAERIIRILRDPNRYKTPSINPRGRFNHDLGHVRLGEPFETSWFFSSDLTGLAESKYKLPMAVWAPGNHAMLLLKGPYKTTDGSWKIRTFDPFRQGEQERDLQNFDQWETAPVGEKSNMLHANGIIANNLAREEIYQNNYDISIANNPDLAPYRQMFVAGKLPRYQYDVSNCVPYTFFANVLLRALKPGATEFKTQGLPQFSQDFGMRIRTVEEIMAET